MKKVFIKIFSLALLAGMLCLPTSCTNMVVRPNASLDVVWGSHGPRVIPRMGVDVYGGGRY